MLKPRKFPGFICIPESSLAETEYMAEWAAPDVMGPFFCFYWCSVIVPRSATKNGENRPSIEMNADLLLKFCVGVQGMQLLEKNICWGCVVEILGQAEREILLDPALV